MSVTVDATGIMTEEENNVASLFNELIGHSILGFQCIILQKDLCEKASFKALNDMINRVLKLVS